MAVGSAGKGGEHCRRQGREELRGAKARARCCQVYARPVGPVPVRDCAASTQQDKAGLCYLLRSFLHTLFLKTVLLRGCVRHPDAFFLGFTTQCFMLVENEEVLTKRFW